MKSLLHVGGLLFAASVVGCAEGAGVADDPDGVVKFSPDAVFTVSGDASRAPSFDLGSRATDAGTRPVDTGATTEDAGLSCAAPRMLCGGGCVDVTVNPAHCGGCNQPCAAGSACVGGACQAGCAAPRATCAGACVDLSSDAANCGACGRACAAGATCVSGACQSTCAAPRMTCSGACVDLRSDAANCGACGRRCTTGQACNAGACASPVTGANVGGACTSDAQCGVGLCVTGSAWPGGYCTDLCDTSDDCDDNAVCVRQDTVTFCAALCTSSRQCRTGYYCRDVGLRSAGVCYPL